MARHDLKRRGSSKKAWALFSAALIASGGLITAQATTEDIDISRGALSFTSAKEKRGSAALSALLTQPTTDGSAGKDIGAEIVAGDYVDYYGLAVVGTRTLDARVTFVSENGLINDVGLDGQLDKLDDYTTGDETENTRIRMKTDFTETGVEDAFI